MNESVTLALIMGGQACLLAVISRLRFRCMPDESGRCVCRSGCSEYPLADSQEAIDAHEFTVGDGQKVLLPSSKINWFMNELITAHPVQEALYRLAVRAAGGHGDRV